MGSRWVGNADRASASRCRWVNCFLQLRAPRAGDHDIIHHNGYYRWVSDGPAYLQRWHARRATERKRTFRELPFAMA